MLEHQAPEELIRRDSPINGRAESSARIARAARDALRGARSPEASASSAAGVTTARPALVAVATAPATSTPGSEITGSGSCQNLFSFEGRIVMTTITAPSLPWDEDLCRPLGEHRHSGALGCMSSEGTRLLGIRTRLSGSRHCTRRRISASTGRWALGHAVVSRTPGAAAARCRALACSARLRDSARTKGGSPVRPHLHQLASEYEYGFVDRKLKAEPAGKAARYLSKYLTKRDGRRVCGSSSCGGSAGAPGLCRAMPDRRYPVHDAQPAQTTDDLDVVEGQPRLFGDRKVCHLLQAFPGASLVPHEPAATPAASP